MLQRFLDEWEILHVSVGIRTNVEVVVRYYAGQLRNAEGRRNSFIQKKSPTISYPISNIRVNPENIHT